MRRSLFKSYLGLCLSIVIISFAILGSLLLGFLGNYWSGEKRSLLLESATSVSDSATEEGYLSFELYSLKYEKLKSILKLVSRTVDADVFFVNADGYTTVCSDDSYMRPCKHREQKISARIMDLALNDGVYDETSDMDGLLERDYYTVGVPLLYSDNNIYGAVFISTDSSALTEYVYEIFKMFILSVILVTMFVFVVAYVMTMRLTKPLRLMADAARSMSRGDFSKRIPANSNDEVGELAVAFNNMTSSLAMLEQMRRSFIANVSHELKTPMTTIAGFIDGILDGTIKEDKQNQYLEIVSDEVKRLSRMVTSMLSLSKLEAGEMKIKPEVFDITETLLRTLLSFEQRIEDKKIHIQGMDELQPALINADPDLIHQVVYNLMDNAIKFTPNKGYIRVQTLISSDTVSFVIRNSGQGISPKELPNIFERFYKTDKSRGVDKSGTGLGLYIVKTIVGIHGGHIVARSIEGEYAEFEVTLRLFKPAPPEIEKNKK